MNGVNEFYVKIRTPIIYKELPGPGTKRKPEPSDEAVLGAVALKSARAKTERLVYPL